MNVSDHPENQTENEEISNDCLISDDKADSSISEEDLSNIENSFLLQHSSGFPGIGMHGTFRQVFEDQDESTVQVSDDDSVGMDSSEAGIVQPSQACSGSRKLRRNMGERRSILVRETNMEESILRFTPPAAHVINGISKPIDSDDLTLPYKECLLHVLHVLRFKAEELEAISCVNVQRFPESSQIIFNPNGEIHYASFSQLIIALTNPSVTDINFQNSFLISFPSFVEPRTFLAALFLRFFINLSYPKSNITTVENFQLMRNRVIRILSKWMDSFPYHFSNKMIRAIEEFLKLIDEAQNFKIQKQIMFKSLERLHGKSRVLIRRVMEQPPLILPPDKPEDEWELIDIPPEELARQITLLHSKYYVQIEPSEILKSIWGDKISCGSNSFSKLNQHFNSFSNYVSISILLPALPQVRAKVFSFWIDVAGYCYNLNNYHGMFCIISGLIHPSVKRLKDTKCLVFRSFSKRKSCFHEMESICNISNNFENYRNMFNNVRGPCVPFIGCFQKDLVYLQETLDDKIDSLINFRKCDECVKIFEKISKHQSERYNFTEQQTIQMLITDIPIEIDIKVLMNVSFKREPKKHS